MKIILKEDVKNLGEVGNIIDVANGYGRNYLIPRDLAIEASPKNLRRFEHEKKRILARADEIKKKSEDLATQISALKVSIEAKAGEEDKLFGSITPMNISDTLAKEGLEVDKRNITLEEPIKRLGSYTVSVKLNQGVTASFPLEVKRMESSPE